MTQDLSSVTARNADVWPTLPQGTTAHVLVQVCRNLEAGNFMTLIFQCVVEKVDSRSERIIRFISWRMYAGGGISDEVWNSGFCGTPGGHYEIGSRLNVRGYRDDFSLKPLCHSGSWNTSN